MSAKVTGESRMPVTRKREAIVLSEEQIQRLQRILSSKNGSRSAIVRARVLLRYTRGEPIKAIARQEGVSRPTVQLCIDKALSGGIETAIQDLSRPGRPRSVTTEGRAWVMQLACLKPIDLGYHSEVWTLSQLTAHVKKHALQAGHEALEHASKYMIRRTIKESPHSPHNVAYYFDKESLEASEGVVSVLLVTKQIELFQDVGPLSPTGQTQWKDHTGTGKAPQTFQITADLASEPHSHPLWFRNHERQRLGLVGLMAGIDLLDGRVIALLQNKSRGNRVGEFLKIVDGCYPSNRQLRIVPGSGVATPSRSNMKALKDYPNRFELDQLRSDRLWLNLLEVLFTRMITSFLRSIRVPSKKELIDRVNQYLDEINLFKGH
jgi:transposase